MPSICGLPNGSLCLGCVITNGWSEKSTATTAIFSLRIDGTSDGSAQFFPGTGL